MVAVIAEQISFSPKREDHPKINPGVLYESLAYLNIMLYTLYGDLSMDKYKEPVAGSILNIKDFIRFIFASFRGFGQSVQVFFTKMV
ncbi:hypothetical protein NYZ99_01200 [Maribacter litopenaei]|uniref:Uncharacterized protein n=1 Tax=Maribacter litopenaei TaxID=2976127 RepID=A0ABY5Y8V4_9FLAO|nr:hypothetical protein [Maribacter litopenaei]UWX55266.1 hypothetical protein NYZ99_01200 [Maribacter litopenaei]